MLKINPTLKSYFEGKRSGAVKGRGLPSLRDMAWRSFPFAAFKTINVKKKKGKKIQLLTHAFPLWEV